jgi:DNA-binding NarL/FixJ family response regulator
VEVVGVATSGEQVERLVRDLLPDVVLVTLREDGIDGIAITRRVRSASSTTQVAMLTQSDTSTGLLNALKAGACGYVNRNGGMAEIVTAVRAVGTGRMVVPTHLALDVLQYLETSSVSPLAASERAILVAAGEGAAASDLAERLQMPDATVRRRIEGIYSKLHRTHWVERCSAVASSQRSNPALQRK